MARRVVACRQGEGLSDTLLLRLSMRGEMRMGAAWDRHRGTTGWAMRVWVRWSSGCMWPGSCAGLSRIPGLLAEVCVCAGFWKAAVWPRRESEW